MRKTETSTAAAQTANNTVLASYFGYESLVGLHLFHSRQLCRYENISVFECSGKMKCNISVLNHHKTHNRVHLVHLGGL